MSSFAKTRVLLSHHTKCVWGGVENVIIIEAGILIINNYP